MAQAGSSAASDKGDHDVCGVSVEVLSPTVVDRRSSGVSVACGDLHITQQYAGVERGHDEPGAEHVRVDISQARSSTDGPDPAMGSAPIEALPILAAQDRSLVAFADRQVNSPRRAGHERDRGRLVALADERYHRGRCPLLHSPVVV